MTGALAGDQWNEGDVSCSVVRRVALPDAFFAIDGLLETFLTVLRQMEVFPRRSGGERAQPPFLATTTILMEAVKNGAGPRDRPRGDQGALPRGRQGHALRDATART
jgi:adenylosuccinate lyase